MNKAILCGNLGNDPELKYTPSGTPVCNFSLATNETWKKDGEKMQKTTWHRCVVWGKIGEVISEHFKKGDKILITDSTIDNRKWEQDGVTRYTSEIVVRGFEFIGAGAPRTAPDSADDSGAEEKPAKKNTNKKNSKKNKEEDDIPFG